MYGRHWESTNGGCTRARAFHEALEARARVPPLRFFTRSLLVSKLLLRGRIGRVKHRAPRGARYMLGKEMHERQEIEIGRDAKREMHAEEKDVMQASNTRAGDGLRRHLREEK
ncbi:unnamed protein product [Lampetra planeri]